MKPIVIDASMAAVWTFPDERSNLGDAILREAREARRISTSLFWYEYRNILVTNQKKARFTEAEIPLLLSKAQSLAIQLHEMFAHEQIVRLALKHGLTAYDASYLALALEEGAVLATNDRRLAQAAFAEGVELRTALETVR